MLRFKDYLFIENKEEYLKRCALTLNGAIEGNLFLREPNHFPAAFRAPVEYDTHFCGYWSPCSIQEMVSAISDEISFLQNRISYITTKAGAE